MTRYSIAYSDGYWELYDGTKIDNGALFPVLCHKKRGDVFEKALTFLISGDQLNIYSKQGKLEHSYVFE